MVPVSRIAVMDFVPRPKECRDPYSVAMGREADALLTVSIRRFLVFTQPGPDPEIDRLHSCKHRGPNFWLSCGPYS